jgi:hypothetical protein
LRRRRVILPAATRYASPGGGTETSTERRIIFSPEIPGRRVGSARPEWAVFDDVIARARPDRRLGCDSAEAIRAEIARAVPLYRGIETLKTKGDQVQWGGPRLYADGRFGTPDGKARFSLIDNPVNMLGQTNIAKRVKLANPDRTFVVSTRRGKQFNSMVQRDVDPLTGAGRDAVLMSEADLHRLNLKDHAASGFDRTTACSKVACERRRSSRGISKCTGPKRMSSCRARLSIRIRKNRTTTRW